jgi:hypothetical protein
VAKYSIFKGFPLAAAEAGFDAVAEAAADAGAADWDAAGEVALAGVFAAEQPNATIIMAATNSTEISFFIIFLLFSIRLLSCSLPFREFIYIFMQ